MKQKRTSSSTMQRLWASRNRHTEMASENREEVVCV